MYYTISSNISDKASFIIFHSYYNNNIIKYLNLAKYNNKYIVINKQAKSSTQLQIKMSVYIINIM